jgi:hypothetical protein
MKKLHILILFLLFILCGCNSLEIKETYSPKLKVKWKYEKDFIKFTIINLSEESILISLPLAETGGASNGDRKIHYCIQHNYYINDNLIPSYTGEVMQYLCNAHFQLLLGAYPKSLTDKYPKPLGLRGGQFYIAKAPCLVKFKNIFEMQVYVNAIPLSSLSTVDDLKSYRNLWSLGNQQTYIVDLTKVGYDKTEGIMELQPK